VSRRNIHLKNNYSRFNGIQRLKINPRKLRVEPLENRWLLSTTIFFKNLNTNPGWTTSGQWAFGQPMGLGGSESSSNGHGAPDPSDAYTDRNVYGVNLNGNYDKSDHESYYLTTTAINCTGYQDLILSYRRWLNTDHPNYAYATIDVSTNGTAWTNIFTNPTETALIENAWSLQQIPLGAYANNQATVYFRWGYQIGSGSYIYSGWNIDDIKVMGTPISAATTRVWDGGSQTNSLWTTPENWAGDVAPLAGDNLLFPADAARKESTNNYSPDTHFGSIKVSDTGYIFHGGISSTANVQISTGTLTVGSIVANTLTIGPTPQTAGRVSAAKDTYAPNDRLTSVTSTPPSIAGDLSSFTATKAAIACTSSDNPAIVEQSSIDRADQNISVKNAASPFVNRAIAMSADVPAVQLSVETSQRENDFVLAESLPRISFGEAFYADLYRTARFDEPALSFLSLLLSAKELDPMGGEWPVSLTEKKTEPSSAFIPSWNAHGLVFQSLAEEYQHKFVIEPEESEFLINKPCRMRDSLATEAVDKFHEALTTAIH
jgi:hypothetical protein